MKTEGNKSKHLAECATNNSNANVTAMPGETRIEEIEPGRKIRQCKGLQIDVELL